jgi:hypothetical protein
MAYNIQPLDTIYSIATRFGVPMLALPARHLMPSAEFAEERLYIRHTPFLPIQPVSAAERSPATYKRGRDQGQRDLEARIARIERHLGMEQQLALHTRQLDDLERRVRRLEEQR